MRVTQTIQAPDNAPVEVQWYTGDNMAKAISAMATALSDDGDSPYYRVLDVRVVL